MERLTNKREADQQRKNYEKRLEQGYPRNIPEERFLKLARYEDLEEQGRLVVLPCKLDADIFRVGLKEVCDYWQVAYAEVYKDEIVMIDDSDNSFTSDDIGKTVFLTREEAEAALKE
jgi:hypothetical protein